MSSIINKIKKNCLIGRGGASFPTYIKWESVAKAKSRTRYLIVNGAEGEPGVYKDRFIIKNNLEDFSLGVKIAFDFIKAKKLYFYLNANYYELYSKKIINSFNKIGLKSKFVIVKKPKDAGYIGGEESAILNIIEDYTAEPRLRPPFPTESGLFGEPTLINNIETIYNVALVSKNKFEKKRLYSVNFANKNKGVYFLADNLSVKEVLKQTNNYPAYDFFVQVGGDASGEVLNSKQLNQAVLGSGSITIHKLENHNPDKLINYWLKFFMNHSCGQCTPCREGTYRLMEMFKNGNLKLDNSDFVNLCQSLSLSSFCALGGSVPIAITSYLKNVYKNL